MAKKISKTELRMEELFESAHKDRKLRARLLANPKAIAKEWKIELGEREVARLEKLGTFVELAEEAKRGTLFDACDPRISYPVTVWLDQEVVELVDIFKRRDWVMYPAPIDWMRRFDRHLGR